MRYYPQRDFPDYIFIPGKNPHPKKLGGHMEGQGDPVSDPISLEHPENNPDLRYALDLFNHGYFWESHVYFEALWNAHKREGSVADFLKALIKLGAAGVKLAVVQKTHAIEHFHRALELLSLVEGLEGKKFLGFDLEKLQSQIHDSIKNTDMKLLIHPEWT